MLFRTHRSFLLLIIAILGGPLRAFAEVPPAEQAAEAQRLYDRANDYVNRISETGYSYAYLQFYWKRAQANVERIIRDYPQTPVGRKLRSNELKLGPYELAYFRERVLPRLEDKKLASFEDVNCAIFLFNRGDDSDPQRLVALADILEVLARRLRWSEALSFSIPAEKRPFLLKTVFRVAARFDQTKIIAQILKIAKPDEQAKLWPILGEAMAVRGEPRADIAKFLDAHPSPEVKQGVLAGMMEREVKIQRAAALRIPEKRISLVDAAIKNTTVRDDVDAVAKTFFPEATPESIAALTSYHAALGEKPPIDAAKPAHLAYLEYLAAFEKFDELAKYVSQARLSAETREACELKSIELYAQGGRAKEAEAARAPFVAAGGTPADLAVLAQFRGQMTSTVSPLRVHSDTFAKLPIKNPSVLAQSIMEWSLAPTDIERRGAAPWDAVVQEFLPGFEDLPLPKSKDVQSAASVQKPY